MVNDIPNYVTIDNLYIETTTEGIKCDIIQNIEIGGNVFFNVMVTTGNIIINYIDSSSTIGATFLGTSTTGTFNPTNSGGFEVIAFTQFSSLDYSSANYIFRFDLTTTTGNINVEGQSS